MDEPGIPRDPRSIGVYPTFVAAASAAADNILPLAGVYLILAVPLGTMLTLGCPTLLGMSALARGGTPLDQVVIPAHEWIALAGSMLFALGVGSWTYAAAYRMADAVLAGEPCPSVPAAYGGAIERVPAFVGTYLCIISLTLVGAMLFLLPGIYVAVALYLAPVRAVARGRGPIGALTDSWALVKGRWWRVFGFVLLVALCIQAVSLPLSLPMQWAATTGAGLPAWYLPALMAFSLLLGIFQLVCNAALHRRLEQLGPVGQAPAPGPVPEDGA